MVKWIEDELYQVMGRMLTKLDVLLTFLYDCFLLLTKTVRKGQEISLVDDADSISADRMDGSVMLNKMNKIVSRKTLFLHTNHIEKFQCTARTTNLWMCKINTKVLLTQYRSPVSLSVLSCPVLCSLVVTLSVPLD